MRNNIGPTTTVTVGDLENIDSPLQCLSEIIGSVSSDLESTDLEVSLALDRERRRLDLILTASPEERSRLNYLLNSTLDTISLALSMVPRKEKLAGQ